MQISCVNYKKLDQGTRLDAEYYKPEFLEIEKLLRKVNCKLLDDVSQSIKSFGAYALCNEMVLVDKGIPFIRCKDIKEGFVDFSDVLFIDGKTHRLLSKSAVTPKTVMLTMSGTVGNCAVADPAWNYPINSNQDIAKIETNESIDPYYLTVFLNGKYGKNQTERLPIGSIQQHIFIWQLRGLLVFIASKDFQNTIAKLYAKAINLLVDSEEFYKEAEQVLLSELGLLNWKPKHRLSFVKKYSDTTSAGRIDAEYFQPMYEDVVKAVISSKTYATLGDIVSIKKCIEPGSEAYQDNGIPFLRVSNLSKFGINNDNQQFISKNLYDSLKTHQPKKGEILLSKDATPGIAYYLKDTPSKMIPSGGILRLSVKDSERVLPEYLTLVLNSVVVQKQIERDAGGSIINHWLVDQVKSTFIPILPIETQKQITEKVNKSFSDRGLSKSLLDIAKRGVEMAIEKDEATAEKLIRDELDKTGVKLDA